MTKPPRSLALVLAFLAAISCSGNATTRRYLDAPRALVEGEGTEASIDAHLDLNIERTALLAADHAYSEFSATTDLVTGTMNMAAPDIVYIAPGSYISSSSQLLQFLQSNPANATAVLTWSAVRADLSSDATRGYTYGYTQIRLPDGTIVPGKYIAYWTRQQDGVWELRAYRRNTRVAGPVSLDPPPGFETPNYSHYRYFPNTQASTTLESVFAVDQAFSDLAEQGVGDAFAVYSAPDAAVLSSSPSIAFGISAIVQNYSSFAPGALVWSPSLGDAAESGDLAFTTGFFSVRQQNSDGTWRVTGTGKYLTVWKRQRTGEWRVVIDG